MHEIVPSDRVALYTRVVAKLGQVLDKVIFDLRSGITLAYNKAIRAEVIPCELSPSCEFMRHGQNDEYPFCPKVLPIAVVCGRCACQEGDIDLKPSNR